MPSRSRVDRRSKSFPSLHAKIVLFTYHILQTMADSPPAKRKRKGGPDVDGKPRPIRSEIWYDDGSVVIQANSTQFRVHRSILSAHSSVLKDMVPNAEELVEGCPIILLSDSAEDMAHLLKALHDRR
jgi:hypothetical protein